MIDIHTHILPNLDDGPINLAESVNLVREAVAEGVSAMLATPHAFNGVFHATPNEIIKKCSLLSQELRKNNIEMSIRPGSEVHLTNDTISNYDKGRVMTLNNLHSHILLELPSMFIIDGVIHIIRQFRERGITTIIAHPERNKTIRKNLHILPGMIGEGALMQITAASLMGGFGRRTMKICEKMVGDNLVSFIGSDIHPYRKFMMRKALGKVLQSAGRKSAEMIFQVNPEEIMFFTRQRTKYGKY